MHGFWSSLGERISGGDNAANLAFLILMSILLLAPLLAKRLHLPALVALVLLGMAVGPYGFGGLKTQQIALTALGEFGLLYLMFAAGLELNLKQLARNKRLAIAFAALSFVIPFSLGLLSARGLGYAWAAAVLMGSNWGSHTLVTYPMLRKMGLARSRPVSLVVGATVLTDTTALLVLAAVSVSTKRNASFAAEATEVIIGLVILVAWSLLALPRLARLFFARVGADQVQRLTFAIVALFIGAILAEAAGIDGIVGAFFAGLGLARAIPDQSPLMDRAQFLGSSLLIPFFLVSVGVLLDPKVMFQPKTLLYALVFTVVVLGGKALAAILVGRRAGFGWPEVGVMSGLSGSQAAATLATTLIGKELKLFDSMTVNAVLLVILTTLVITPAVVSAAGRRAARARTAAQGLGHRVVVPVWSDAAWPLLPVAERLAEEDEGIVIATTFALEDADEQELAAQKQRRNEAEEHLAQCGLEGQALFRVVSSPLAGMIKSVHAEEGTLIVGEWDSARSHLERDRESLEQITHSPVPMVLVRGDVEAVDRVVIAARADDLHRPGSSDFELAVELGRRLVPKRAPYVVGTAEQSLEGTTTSDPFGWVEANLQQGDLLLLPGIEAARAALARSPNIIGKRFVVAVASATRH